MSWKETDPLALWKRSTVVPLREDEVRPEDRELKEKSKVAERLHGKRSILWTSLLELPAEQRQGYLHKLVHAWPDTWERRAITYPTNLLAFSCGLSSGYIAARINADIFLLNSKVRLGEVIAKTPTLPLAFAVYLNGISAFSLHRFCVYKPLVEDEEHQDPKRIAAKIFAIQMWNAVGMPVLSNPHLSYYMKLQREPKYYQAKNYIESITLSYEFSRSVWRLLPRLVAIQAVLTGIATFCLNWGRKRIFNTADMDPDYIREVMFEASQKLDFIERVKRRYYSTKGNIEERVPIGSKLPQETK